MKTFIDILTAFTCHYSLIHVTRSFQRTRASLMSSTRPSHFFFTTTSTSKTQNARPSSCRHQILLLVCCG